MVKENIKLSDKDLANVRDVMMRDMLMNYSREVMKEYAKILIVKLMERKLLMKI